MLRRAATASMLLYFQHFHGAFFEIYYHHYPKDEHEPRVFATTTTTAADGADEEEISTAGPADTRQPEAATVTAPKVSESQAALIKKLHNNTGHPPLERFLRTLRSAGALPHVLQYVRDEFRCPDCELKKSPDPRRRAQCPRVFGFNKVLSIDVFYLRYQNSSVPLLNMVCSGTDYQVVQRVAGNSQGTPTSAMAWQTFLQTWVRSTMAGTSFVEPLREDLSSWAPCRT